MREVGLYGEVSLAKTRRVSLEAGQFPNGKPILNENGVQLEGKFKHRRRSDRKLNDALQILERSLNDHADP